MEHIGVVVSGGPAPGINSLISALVIEAQNNGHSVLGLTHGFEGICRDGRSALRPLEINEVSRLAHSGGSILGTSRFNPLQSLERESAFIKTLGEAEIRKLVVIGGDGSAVVSHKIATKFPEITVVHTPKTIDNDIPLPGDSPCFGYESAREAGTRVVEVLMTDAKTDGKRWFLVTSMGRKAGFLALGIGAAAGATVTLIPEEFGNSAPTLEFLADILTGSIRKRLDSGKRYGVALLAEGILDLVATSGDPRLKSLPRDELGRIIHSDADISALLLPLLRERFKTEGLRFIHENLGYELRCAAPVAFDIEYTRYLAVGAIQSIVRGETDRMVVRIADRLETIPLASIFNEQGTVDSRVVNTKSDRYRVARSFMIR